MAKLDFISSVNSDFRRRFSNLTRRQQSQARAAYAKWKENPSHPSLQFKLIEPRLWSIRIPGGYRALARQTDQRLVWFFIGPHDEYERQIRLAR